MQRRTFLLEPVLSTMKIAFQHLEAGCFGGSYLLVFLEFEDEERQ